MKYTAENDFNKFKLNEWDQDAVLRNLEVIGEASNNIEDEFLKQYPQIPWRTIINLRNVLIHDYADVDLNIIWQIISKDLPNFYKEIVKILNI